ncbi:MAG TPA: hypothetical protein VF242_06635 [Nitrososphaeraceae archaeon]
MSGKKRVILVFGSLVVISIIVNIAIIASNGGFQNPSQSIKIPNTQDLWSAGINIKEGDELLYNLTIENGNSNFENYLIKMVFKNNQDYWNTEFTVSNESISTLFYGNFSKSNLIMKEKSLKNQKYLDIIESSILQIRDITREPKYLVIGAKWDSIDTGVTSIPIKINSIENLSTSIGNLETFLLNYNIKNKNSNIWISKALPLPVKAEIYNVDGLLKYKYKLLSTNIRVN